MIMWINNSNDCGENPSNRPADRYGGKWYIIISKDLLHTSHRIALLERVLALYMH